MLQHTSVTYLLKKILLHICLSKYIVLSSLACFWNSYKWNHAYIFLYNLVFSFNIVFVAFLHVDVHSYGSFLLMCHILLYNYTTIYLSILFMGIFLLPLVAITKNAAIIKNILLHFSLYVYARFSISQCSLTCRSKPIKRRVTDLNSHK